MSPVYTDWNANAFIIEAFCFVFFTGMFDGRYANKDCAVHIGFIQEVAFLWISVTNLQCVWQKYYKL